VIFLQVAIVTGASSGIGLAVSKKLIANNYKVYGIARDFAKVDFQHPNFVNVDCDLQDITELQKKTSEIIKSEKNITVLVNNAGIGYFGWLEELKISDIAEMVSTNLLAPFILTKLLLRHLKKTGGLLLISLLLQLQNQAQSVQYMPLPKQGFPILAQVYLRKCENMG